MNDEAQVYLYETNNYSEIPSVTRIGPFLEKPKSYRRVDNRYPRAINKDQIGRDYHLSESDAIRAIVAYRRNHLSVIELRVADDRRRLESAESWAREHGIESQP